MAIEDRRERARAERRRLIISTARRLAEVEGWEALRSDRRGGGSAADALTRVAHAYVDFACADPALYAAMFTRASKLPFTTQDVPSPVTEAFDEVREGVSAVARGADGDTLTEVFWAALHGLTTLARDGWLRAGYDYERVDLLAARFAEAT